MTEHILYNEKFYAVRRAEVIPSAEAIMGLIFKMFHIESVIDFGCGTGTWLNAAQSLGATNVTGIEGDWLKDEFLDSPNLDVIRKDLANPVRIEGTYDLAISLEVGEHLLPERAASFVEDICRTSKKVLFSAAIPNQGGVGHLNEQWQSYWAEHFLKHDFVPFDVIRPEIWSNSDISFWYRQNTILYLHKDEIENNGKMSFPLETKKPADLNIVHPEQYSKNMNLRLQLRKLGFIQRLKILVGR